MKKIALCFFVVLFASSVASAHKDRILKITANGQIQGYAKNYGDIRFEVDKWMKTEKKHGASVARFKVGTKVLPLPSCLSQIILKSSFNKVNAVGSWFHDLKALPPYVSIRVPTQKPSALYTFVFDVKDVRLVNLNKKAMGLNEDGEEAMIGQNIALREICSEKEIQSMTGSVDTKSLKK